MDKSKTLQHTATHCNSLQLTATHCRLHSSSVVAVRSSSRSGSRRLRVSVAVPGLLLGVARGDAWGSNVCSSDSRNRLPCSSPRRSGDVGSVLAAVVVTPGRCGSLS